MNMSNNYLQPVNNHFDLNNDIADVDDDIFLKKSRGADVPLYEQDLSSNGSLATGGNSISAYAEKRRQIEERCLDSTQKSLGLLYETEEVGKATAVELAKQREQLEKTSRNLDEINSTLRFSQRHLNGLKSVFGGLRNYLSGNREQPGTGAPSPTSSQISQEANSNATPIGTKLAKSPTESYDNHPIRQIRGDPSALQQRQVQQQQQFSTNPFQSQLESNLDDMCDNLSRLKFLATDLGTEIESQNELLDNMNYKIEDVDLKMTKQNKDMNKLLKK